MNLFHSNGGIASRTKVVGDTFVGLYRRVVMFMTVSKKLSHVGDYIPSVKFWDTDWGNLLQKSTNVLNSVHMNDGDTEQTGVTHFIDDSAYAKSKLIFLAALTLEKDRNADTKKKPILESNIARKMSPLQYVREFTIFQEKKPASISNVTIKDTTKSEFVSTEDEVTLKSENVDCTDTDKSHQDMSADHDDKQPLLDSRRIILRNIRPGTSELYLKYFLEGRAVTRKTPKVFPIARQVVLVQFSEEITDFDRLKERIEAKKLNDVTLTMERVPVTDTVVIHSKKQVNDTLREKLKRDLERVAGEIVKTHETNSEKRKILFRFKDHKSVDKVMEKNTYKIADKHTVTVRRYYDCHTTT